MSHMQSLPELNDWRMKWQLEKGGEGREGEGRGGEGRNTDYKKNYITLDNVTSPSPFLALS